MFRPLPTVLMLIGVFLLPFYFTWAQDTEAQTELQIDPAPEVIQPPDEAGNIPADTDAIWHDAQLMWVVAELGLSPEQIQVIIPLLQEWQTRVVAARAQEDQLWQTNQAAIETVLQAWMAHATPDAAAIAAANEMATTIRAIDDSFASSYATYEAQVSSLLSEEQMALIESPQEEQLRSEIALYCDGFDSIADFMVHLMEMHRELMPDEYNLVRLTSAARIAMAVEHFENADYALVEEDALKMLDQAADWPDDRYEETLPKLPDAIRRRLNLQNDPIARPISQNLFHHWLTDSRTALLLASWGTATLPPPEAQALEVPWEDASEAADIISLLSDMQVEADQLNGIASLSGAAITETQRIDAERSAILAPVLTQLQQVVPYLLSGQQLTPEWLSFFRDLNQQLKSVKRNQDRAVIPFINALRKLLSPQQANLVDWRIPPDVKGVMSLQELAETARDQATQMDEAIALCEVLRPFDPMTYLQVRLVRIEKFMEKYFDDNDPQWVDIRGKIADITLTARGVQPDNWNAAAPGFALDILETVGITFDDEAWRPSNRPLSWNAMRNVLLSKQTTWVANGMANASMINP